MFELSIRILFLDAFLLSTGSSESGSWRSAVASLGFPGPNNLCALKLEEAESVGSDVSS
jgi:hypothetical protein